MKLHEALANPGALSPNDVQRLIRVGLCDAKRRLTPLAERLLRGELAAAKELAENCSPPVSGPDWVIPPPPFRQSRVFGPAASCGDMAAHSLGY